MKALCLVLAFLSLLISVTAAPGLDRAAWPVHRCGGADQSVARRHIESKGESDSDTFAMAALQA